MSKILGVIGYPVDHSLSPVIHNAWFGKYGLDADYLKFSVKTEDLANAVNGLRGLNIFGVNVTVPHKKRVPEYLNGTDEISREIGAVNTIKNQNGTLLGFNTDFFGFKSALEDRLKYRFNAQSRILLFGAGGVAATAAYYLASRNMKRITLINRTEGNAHILNEKFNLRAEIRGFNAINSGFLSEFDLIINCTSVGLKAGEILFDNSLLKSYNGKIFDIPYRAGNTELVNESHKLNINAIDGKYMLIYQAAKSFEIWFGFFPDIGIIKLLER